MPELEVKPPTASTADIVDIFKGVDDNKDDKPVEKKIAKEDKEEKELPEEVEEDDDIELKDIEDDDDVTEDDKLDLTKQEDEIEIDAPPRKKEILKEFPELFKKFPFLEKVMYRDKQYSELFGSFDDAKDAAERVDTFNIFEKQLLSGKTEEILKNVKENDSKAFDRIVDNYLESLHKVDKDAYFDVVNGIGKRLIQEMVREGNESSNDELKQAALIINQFLGWGSKFTPATKRVNDKDTEHSEVEQERQAYVQERLEDSVNTLQGKVDNVLKSTISEYIDPKGVMSSYVKKNAVADALKMVQSSIGSDTSVKRSLDKLWHAAIEAKFSKDSLGRIQSFYLGRAKSSLKTAIQKARTEALKDLAPRAKEEVEEKDEKEEITPRRGTLSAGKPSQPKSKNEMRKGESVAEFFARD